MKLLKQATVFYITTILAIILTIVGCQQPIQAPGRAGDIGTPGLETTNANPPIVVEVLRPFATGNISTNTTLYSANVIALNGAWTSIETVTVRRPSGYVLDELELSLIGRVYSHNATSLIQYRWMGSDDNISWQALASRGSTTYSGNSTGITTVNSTSWIDTYPYQGRFKPTGNFTATKDWFYLKFDVASTLTTNTTASTKASSYIIATCRRLQ